MKRGINLWINIRKFFTGFKYAGRGVWLCIVGERNFRVHMVASLTVLIFSCIYGVSNLEAAILVLTCTVVLALEAVNTAVEAAVDNVSKDKSPCAKNAKDAAAGAVLIAAVGAIAVAVCVFGDVGRLAHAFSLIFSFPRVLVAVIYIVLAVWFVFGFKRR